MRWTIRLRLTLLYGALFFATGAVLLAVTYVLAAQSWPWAFPRPARLPGPLDLSIPLPGKLAEQRAEDLDRLLASSAVALGLMTVLSVGLGWFTAGRALRPLRTLASTAQAITANDLTRRFKAGGPTDEIRVLADTFDDLLGRLERAFEAERRFVANASHELRTPLTFERSLLEVALADPEASAGDLRSACERVLASNQQQAQLIDALLTLARSRRAIGSPTGLDLRDIAEPLLDKADGLRIESDLNPAGISGNPALVERLFANLVDNAVRHNLPGGSVAVWTGVRDGRAGLRVRNTGPVVPAGEVSRLFEPFQRLAGRTAGKDGHGVGLSIVAAVAEAHGAEVDAEPVPGGGLDIRVTFAAHPGEPASTHRA